MATAATNRDAAAVIGTAIEDTVSKLRASLQKEGADMEVAIDSASETLNVTLVRNRIICEACIQPEKLVRTMLNNAIRANPDASALRFKIEAHNWEL